MMFKIPCMLMLVQCSSIFLAQLLMLGQFIFTTLLLFQSELEFSVHPCTHTKAIHLWHLVNLVLKPLSFSQLI